MDKEQRKELLLAAIKAVLDAGQEILKVYHSDDFEVQLKSDDSPLTLADRMAHEAIAAVLEPLGIPMLSEEGKELSFEERKDWNTLWIVDPLDGTKEFIKRNDEFTVNIALVQNNQPVCGVIYVPVYRQLYVGDLELGAFRWKEIQEWKGSLDDLISSGESLPVAHETDAYTMVGSRSHMNAETKAFIDQLKEENGNVEFVSKGSSLKLCMIAEGLADVYPRFAPTMEWDIAAGQAIVEAAGYSVRLHNSPESLKYNKEDLTNPWFIAGR
ncbi:MAG: 3'(2'),5'-bisphosphate nucleotidase CysQ [Marinifilaceae bacterium]